MLIQVDNRLLVKDREKTYLTAAVSASASGNQAITVRAVDSNAWADDDYVIVGEIGTENAEIMRISASVSDGTALTLSRTTTSGSDVGGLRYDHAINEPVFRIDFNRVEFSRSATDDSGASSVLITIEVQPDDIFTRFEDTTNTTGFAFVRFNDEESSLFSSFSDGIPYAGQSAKSLAKLRAKVRILINEPDIEFIQDTDIDEALNDRQREIAHERLWSFYEVERSFASVANQFAYDIPSTVKDGTIHTITFRTQPLSKLNRTRWNALHWDTDTSTTDPWGVSVWNDQIKVYPRPSGAAVTTAINDGAGITATATSVTVDSSTSFQRGDYFRFIIESEVIYATGSTSTTFIGLLRGQEGTTAATHADDVTITERDIVYTGQVEPTDLVDVNDETDVPEPLVLAHGAAADLALKLEKETLHDRLVIRFDKGLEELKKKYTIKITGQFTKVKIRSEVSDGNAFFRNPNNFPVDI